jgi:hypothetical protein
MLLLVLYFLLSLILIFQGTHLAGEVRSPLGTLPDEVAQNPVSAMRWGILLIASGILLSVLGLLGYWSTRLATARPGLLLLGLAILILYGVWIVFLGRKAEFIGKPAAADNHGHH